MDRENYKKLLHSISVPGALPVEEKNKRYKPIIDFLQTEIPSSLYRYRSCGELSFDAFSEDQLWFSKPKVMNDDFDALISYDEEVIKRQITENFQRAFQIVNAIRSGEIVGEIVPEPIKQVLPQMETVEKNILQTSAGDIQTRFAEGEQFFQKDAKAKLPPLSTLLQNTIKIACFSESIESGLMWGHYADNSCGFALAYDFRDFQYPNCGKYNIPCSNGGAFNLFPVVYSEERFDATEYISWLWQQKMFHEINGFAEDQKALFKKLFPCPDDFMATKIVLHKSNEWAPEKEWRMTFFYLDSDIQNQEHSFGIKKPVAIYLGRKIKPINQKILLSIAKEKDIPVYKMELAPNTYALKSKLIQGNPGDQCM